MAFKRSAGKSHVPVSEQITGSTKKKKKIPKKRACNLLSKEQHALAHTIMRYGVEPAFLKPFGDVAASQWVEPKEMCPTDCGCRMRTDGNVDWCSFVKCDFIRKSNK